MKDKIEISVKNLITIGAIILISSIFAIQNNQKIDNADSLFEKQERCSNNRENAKKQLEGTYSLATPYFYDIFYSPKTETCVYTYGVVLYGVSPRDVGGFMIADYFTGEQLFSVDYDNSTEDSSEYSYNKRPLFSEKVEEYREN